MRTAAFMFCLLAVVARAQHALLIQTDFGDKSGAVAAMKGVAYSVDPKLAMFDLSNRNTPFDVWEAGYRLREAAPYWPAGTVFVSVVDPGGGTTQKPVVLLTKSGHYFVAPDNGVLTYVADRLGIQALREIDVARHHRPGSENVNASAGRDMYVYVAAQLASGRLRFEDAGPLLPPVVVALAHEPARRDGGAVIGSIPVLDTQYGNVWTNIDDALFAQLEPKTGSLFHVTITKGDEAIYEENVPFVASFGDVAKGHPLLYVNSLQHLALALNQGNFAKANAIESGAGWRIRIEKATP
ncbi:MAG TPA: SAM-dependent chlorinase/fluorinase [Opitutus sp.]|nr:SAM-dependent chlorinase/fluorinase [Opitutus sp.]